MVVINQLTQGSHIASYVSFIYPDCGMVMNPFVGVFICQVKDCIRLLNIGDYKWILDDMR